MEARKGQFFERYQLGDQTGKGGMAIVYKAYDTRLEKQVALKIIRTDRITPEMADKTLKRFEREAKAAAQLEHPNIIKVLDFGKANGSPFIVMEYLPGGTLKKRLSNGAVSWQQAVNTLLPVAHALRFAHERNIIHRDVKPSNILFNQADQPVLSDFGIVKILGDEVTQDLSSTGFMIGTPEYMSPEQATGATFDHRVDIYALGIVFYEMVTGRRPFNADTPVGVLVKHASEPLPRPTRYIKNIPPGVESFLLKVLAKDPDQRYQSMEDVIDAFNSLIRSNGNTITSSGATTTFSMYGQDPATVTASYVSPKPAPSWSKKIIVGGLVIALLCLGGLGAGWALNLFPLGQPEVTGPGQSVVSVPSNTPPRNTAPPSQKPTSTDKPTTISNPTAAQPSTADFPLKSCTTGADEDACVYSINPQPNNTLIISLIFKKNLNQSALPYLMVGSTRFKCEVLAAYPDRLYCNGAATSGSKELTLFSRDGTRLGFGQFNIPRYIPPSPTPRKGGGGNYP